jgi:predicted amidophosphoribosyltransferase
MLICDSCKQEGNSDYMVQCPKCKRTFHKNVRCVKVKETKFEQEKECPTCGQKTNKINERLCPYCGEHLWNFHIDCGGVF